MNFIIVGRVKEPTDLAGSIYNLGVIVFILNIREQSGANEDIQTSDNIIHTYENIKLIKPMMYVDVEYWIELRTLKNMQPGEQSNIQRQINLINKNIN